MKNWPILLLASACLAIAAAPAGAQMPPESVGTTTPPSLSNPPAQVQLTPAQKTAILDAIHQKGGSITPPKDFHVATGEQVPPSIELYPLPDGVMAQMPETKLLKYTMMKNQIVLVDPTTMRVVDTISQ